MEHTYPHSWGGGRAGGQHLIPGCPHSICPHLVHTHNLPGEEGPTKPLLPQEAQKYQTLPSASDKLLQRSNSEHPVSECIQEGLGPGGENSTEVCGESFPTPELNIR